MASVTNYNTKNMDKGYCEKCGAFFLYNKTQELYAEHNSFLNLGEVIYTVLGVVRKYITHMEVK